MRRWLGKPEHPGARAKGLDLEAAGRLHVGLHSCASGELLFTRTGRMGGSAAGLASPGPSKGRSCRSAQRSGCGLELQRSERAREASAPARRLGCRAGCLAPALAPSPFLPGPASSPDPRGLDG